MTTNDKIKRCFRCGKIIIGCHYVNNKPVCADDRLCYHRPNNRYRRRKSKPKAKVLARMKAKLGEELYGNEIFDQFTNVASLTFIIVGDVNSSCEPTQLEVITYTVHSGDTLWSIASNYAPDSIRDVREFMWQISQEDGNKNLFKAGRRLQVGDQILIPISIKKQTLCQGAAPIGEKTQKRYVPTIFIITYRFTVFYNHYFRKRSNEV